MQEKDWLNFILRLINESSAWYMKFVKSHLFIAVVAAVSGLYEETGIAFN